MKTDQGTEISPADVVDAIDDPIFAAIKRMRHAEMATIVDAPAADALADLCAARVALGRTVATTPEGHAALIAFQAFGECEDGKRVSPTRPQDVSGMSPTAVAYWIATKGGSLEFDVADVKEWRSAFDALLMPIVLGDVEIVGRRFGGNELPKKVPGHVFVGILVDYPYRDWSEIEFTDEPYLECNDLIDKHQHSGCDDKLFAGWRRCEWTHLRVTASDVARLWPFERAHALQPPEATPVRLNAYPFPPDLPKGRARQKVWYAWGRHPEWKKCGIPHNLTTAQIVDELNMCRMSKTLETHVGDDGVKRLLGRRK